MKRREFMTLLGGAAVWPIATRAQQSAMPVVGVVNTRDADSAAYLIPSLEKGLRSTGFIPGRNVLMEYSSAETKPERLPAIVEAFVRRDVAVIVALGTSAALTAKAATRSIPIVYGGGSDPVALGLVSSLNQPGGNVTGGTVVSHLIGAKRLDILRLLVPDVAHVALLVEPSNPSSPSLIGDTEAAARAMSIATTVHAADNLATLGMAFRAIANEKVDALFVGGGPTLGSLRKEVTEHVARSRLPAIYSLREYVEVGGLMSYGSDFGATFLQVGEYVGRILHGEKPAKLPIQQSSKFELVVNLKTARNIGLAIPDKLISLADEVIE
jgi:putative ABC transport system substrate-binding protein